VLVSDSEQQGGKLVPLLPAESGEQSILMLPRHRADLFQDLPTLRQMKGMILSVPQVSASAQVVKAIFFLSFMLGGVCDG